MKYMPYNDYFHFCALRAFLHDISYNPSAPSGALCKKSQSKRRLTKRRTGRK